MRVRAARRGAVASRLSVVLCLMSASVFVLRSSLCKAITKSIFFVGEDSYVLAVSHVELGQSEFRSVLSSVSSYKGGTDRPCHSLSAQTEFMT